MHATSIASIVRIILLIISRWLFVLILVILKVLFLMLQAKVSIYINTDVDIALRILLQRHTPLPIVHVVISTVEGFLVTLTFTKVGCLHLVLLLVLLLLVLLFLSTTTHHIFYLILLLDYCLVLVHWLVLFLVTVHCQLWVLLNQSAVYLQAEVVGVP